MSILAAVVIVSLCRVDEAPEDADPCSLMACPVGTVCETNAANSTGVCKHIPLVEGQQCLTGAGHSLGKCANGTECKESKGGVHFCLASAIEQKKDDSSDSSKPWLWVIVAVGALACVAGTSFATYKVFHTPGLSYSEFLNSYEIHEMNKAMVDDEELGAVHDTQTVGKSGLHSNLDL
eukprot:TRINITY_DN18_c0_g3_i2.p1 TRINITY_DN18_c0_g3~~TRINITY_DN18_c0_g3_i2.p1  ORF type:complete len:178 (+),score=32.16 TRINITY_DN18_c0_g3_i2:98-631(+)